MTIDDAIVAFGQVASGDFDTIELEVRDYERLVKWLTELKLARESAFSDIGVAARAISENHQFKDENARLREQMERLVTLLRVDCDIDASWDGLRRFWTIGLTDGGCLMRDRACEAEAENAQLREFASKAFSMAFNFYHGAGTAEDLRELKVEYHELGVEVDG